METKENDDCNNKLTWETKELALAARAYAGWQYGKAEVRPYQCKLCGKWHLARSHEK
jgi:hypothetical protein